MCRVLLIELRHDNAAQFCIFMIHLIDFKLNYVDLFFRWLGSNLIIFNWIENSIGSVFWTVQYRILIDLALVGLIFLIFLFFFLPVFVFVFCFTNLSYSQIYRRTMQMTVIVGYSYSIVTRDRTGLAKIIASQWRDWTLFIGNYYHTSSFHDYYLKNARA